MGDSSATRYEKGLGTIAPMPWKESRVMDERIKFVAEVLKGERKITDLCEHHGISRKTGYKWTKRYEEVGPVGLENLGR
jgi:transposase-like protein